VWCLTRWTLWPTSNSYRVELQSHFVVSKGLSIPWSPFTRSTCRKAIIFCALCPLQVCRSRDWMLCVLTYSFSGVAFGCLSAYCSTTRTQKTNRVKMNPEIVQAQSWRYSTIVVIKRQQQNHHIKQTNKHAVRCVGAWCNYQYSFVIESCSYAVH